MGSYARGPVIAMKNFFLNSAIPRILNIKLKTLLIICIVFIFSAFTVNLVSGQFNRAYTSDDVANQYIVQSLLHQHNGHAILPVDSFITHFPLYMLTDLIIHGNTRRKLFLQAFLLSALFLTSIVISLVYYLRKTKLYGKASVLISTLVLSFILSTPLFASYMLAINNRQLEIGIALLLMVAAHIFLSSKSAPVTRKNILYGVAYVLTMGILWYDDPYFMYIMAGGAVLTTIFMWVSKKVSWQKIATTLTVLLSSAALVKIYGLLFEKLGIHLAPNGSTVMLDAGSIFTNIQNTLVGFFFNFNGNLFGLDVIATEKKTLLPLVCGAVLAILAIASLLHSTKSYLKNSVVLRTLLSTTAVSLLLVIVLTTTGTIITERYFIFLPILLTPLITEYLLHIYKSRYYRFGQLLTALLSIGLLLMLATNTYSILLDVTHKKIRSDNSVNYDIIKTVESAGYVKGYANYWQGNINTYLSSNRIHALPVVCSYDKTQAFHWLVNDNDFKTKATKTFYLIDPSITVAATCSIEDNIKQFGEPSKILSRDGRFILLYDYDIMSKM